MPDTTPTCVFTVDVEDWFHILDLPSAPELSQWSDLPSRVQANFLRLIELFSYANVKCTCFFLGWVAQKFPHLVKLADRLGYEVASHGHEHRLIYSMTPKQFREDAARARKTLEDTVGRPVLGFRAPGFSFIEKTPWFYDELLLAGYQYDSSLFPARRAHGGWKNNRRDPHVIDRELGQIVEFPITVEDIAGTPICFFGGGYLRLFPLRLIECMARKVLRQNRQVVFYVHPRDVDPMQPRLPMSVARKIKCYVNLATTEHKISRLLQDFSFTTLASLVPQILATSESPVERVRRLPGAAAVGVLTTK